MNTESNFDNLSQRQRGRLTFDPTVNAGHILTFFGFMISGFLAYSALDKRVAVIEVRTANAEIRVVEQDQRIKDTLGEIKQDLRNVKDTINEMAARPDKP